MKSIKLSNHNTPHTQEEKQQRIVQLAVAYESFLDATGIDWRNDPNARDTPIRVAKAWVNDIAAGCYAEPPKITAFDNVERYDGMVVQCNIPVTSLCSHHHAPFLGRATVGYIPGEDGKVIGLSKLNRIVDFFARRPQVQENLTMQIHDYINSVCEGNSGVAVFIEAKHTCCSSRGIKHDSTMKTAKVSGFFLENRDGCKDEFYKFIE